MRKFNVTVNGVAYDVEIEEVGNASVQTVTSAAPAAVKTEKTVPAAKNPTPVGGTEVKAPMPGTILKVNVTAGQSVKKGDIRPA